MKGRLFVISGPSGCGKTTLCKILFKRRPPNIVRSISATTRPPRRDEIDGEDYIYVSRLQFQQDLKNNKFLEHAKVFGQYYGTPRKFVLDSLRKGRDVILSIDVQGASQIKKAFRGAILIFILPPSTDDLRKRLQKRSSDTKEQINKRLKIAHTEMRAIGMYDFVVVNENIKEAVDNLISIIKTTPRKKG